MKGYPYVPWYHGDFLRSTSGWTLTERAVYFMLLACQWEQGVLPADPARLASIAGCDAQTFADAWRIVGPKFPPAQGGIANERMAAHRNDYERYRRDQSKRGKQGMAVRWGKGKVLEFPASAEQKGPLRE